MDFSMINIGLLVLFVVTMTVAIYMVLPSSERLREMMETFSEKQETSLEAGMKQKRSVNISAKLKRAGINMHPILFRVLCLASAVIVAIFVWKYTNNLIAGCIIAILGYQIPFWILNFLNKNYDQKMDVQIGILLSTTPQTISTSGSIDKALESMTRTVDQPLRGEINKILGASRLGQSLEDGFAELAIKTGHDELRTYGKFVSTALYKGTAVAADSFARLHKVVEMEKSLERDKKAQLSEYTMFIVAMLVGLPLAYVGACTFSETAQVSLTTWGLGKIATIGIAIMIVGSYLGYKSSTRTT